MSVQTICLITLSLSFCFNQQNPSAIVNAPGEPTKNIRFEFTAKRMDNKETLEIQASLFNDGSNTLYFLSSTCDGEQYSLRYDTSAFKLSPHINCNASYPMVIKIAPGGQHNFRTYFIANLNTSKIKLGFDLYTVDQYYKVNDKFLSDINIFNRSKSEQTIVWAAEKTIK